MDAKMFKNPKGQEVGQIEGNSYKTSRSAKEGQIYLYKHRFGGKYFKMAVGIQKSILDTLKRLKISFVDIIIIGIEERSYLTRTKVEDIIKDGVEIKEDRGNSNITKWGRQYIWDIADKKLDLNQKTLR